MRVPIPVVILLCSCVIGGVWWTGTREKDFLSPPAGYQIDPVPEKSDATPPPLDTTDDEVEGMKKVDPSPAAPSPEQGNEAAESFAITLHATTSKTNTELLAPALEEVALHMEQASSGVLKIGSSLKAGSEISTSTGSPPIALWISGAGNESSTTQTLVFRNVQDGSLRDQVSIKFSRLIRSYLAGNANEDPPDAIQSGMTRSAWLQLGSSLNKTLE